MGNKLEKNQTQGERFNRLGKIDSHAKLIRSRSLAGKNSLSELNAPSFQELNSQKSRPLPSIPDRFGRPPRKTQTPPEEFQRSTYTIERFKRKSDKVNFRELDQAVGFSRHLTEAFFQQALNPPIGHSALFPASANLKIKERETLIPERFRNLSALHKEKNQEEKVQFMPERQEFQLLIELFKGPTNFKETETVVISESLFQNPILRKNHNPKNFPESRLPENKTTIPKILNNEVNFQLNDKSVKVSTNFLIENDSQVGKISSPIKTPAPKKTFQPQIADFSSGKSFQNSSEKNNEDSGKSNQFSNEKQGRFQGVGRNSSTFKINEGHLFSFQRELSAQNKLSSRRTSVPKEIIVEETNDDREEESSINAEFHPPQKDQAFIRKFSSRGTLPFRMDAKMFDCNLRSSRDNFVKDENTSRDELEETIDRFPQIKQNQSDELKTQEGYNAQKSHPVRFSLGENIKNTRPNSITDKSKQITLDLQLLLSKSDKKPNSISLLKMQKQEQNSQIALPVSIKKIELNNASNNRYKSSSSTNLPNQPEPKLFPFSNFASKVSDSKQKPIANSLKTFLSKKDSVQIMEAISKDFITTKSNSKPELVNSNTQPKIMNKIQNLKGNSVDPNSKTYSSLFAANKTGHKPLPSNPKPKMQNGIISSKKEKIIENSSKIVSQLREEAIHRRNFSGFSHVRPNEQTQEFESESIEYKIFENILGDLQKQESQTAKVTSNNKGNRFSYSSKDSSKHNIQIDIGSLSRQVQFNLESCFRKN